MLYLFILFCLYLTFRDLSEGGWEGYWRKTGERNKMLCNGGLKLGKLAWRSYNSHR